MPQLNCPFNILGALSIFFSKLREKTHFGTHNPTFPGFISLLAKVESGSTIATPEYFAMHSARNTVQLWLYIPSFSFCGFFFFFVILFVLKL